MGQAMEVCKFDLILIRINRLCVPPLCFLHRYQCSEPAST